MAKTQLQALLSEHASEVIQAWIELVSGPLHPAAMPVMELVDHLPVFIEEVATALRGRSDPAESAVAPVHGATRLALGFNLDSVVREYGAIRNAVVAVAERHHVEVSRAEYQVLFDCVISGIAGAVSEYARQRDAEMHRQATEHFAFVSHELRNPLSSALMAMKLLKSDGTLAAENRFALVLDRSLTRMHDLIEQTLRLAQFGSNVTVRLEPARIPKLLEEVLAETSADAETKGVRVVVEIESDEEIQVDARLVRSALSNLVRNAIKFTREAGVVTVRAKVAGGTATIEVQDQCGGLPEGDTEKAFSPFVQMGGDRTGFGLGLAIAKQAVLAHEGTLRVQNLPGTGCIFVLELPVAPRPDPAEVPKG